MSTTVFSRDMIPAADLTAADVTPAPALPEVLPPRKARGRVGMFVWRHPTIAVGGLLVFLIVAMAVFAPFLGTVDPTALAPARRTRPPPDAFAWASYWLSQLPWEWLSQLSDWLSQLPWLGQYFGGHVGWQAPRPPPSQYWFGSDMLGRDIYSRVLYGARVSLIVGFSVAVCSSVIGMTIGLLSGFIRILDTVIMRIMDGLMSIPSILLAIALMALTRASVENVVIAITIAEVPRVSRLVRGVVLSLREQPYVEAAIASGTRVPKIIWKHILPNTLAPITVQATFICASAMITEATLSFIGAGTPPIIPSWGNIMAEGRALWQVKPYIVFFPAVFLSITVLAVNLLGDGLRDALDPRLAKRI
jgi:peptide/nickel transport system permease protein